ncbi:dopa 4,5-dioxygenase family domain-containing protein [Rhizoctonia solani AG-1 IA]|uniref:Dopa 4,5-dioxygenase family domain-containing protein n=1 Tax=Thanatephorus cucumeris (strain AG1-IA) TaxID=983506 RepID=L8X3U4_THACA|nr:dopa 4,5-dioxygenase family domain-containing protein [Rhizoctonia solani AG-1 IA]
MGHLLCTVTKSNRLLFRSLVVESLTLSSLKFMKFDFLQARLGLAHELALSSVGEGGRGHKHFEWREPSLIVLPACLSNDELLMPCGDIVDGNHKQSNTDSKCRLLSSKPSSHIYFLQRNAAQHAAALALRDAILRLRRDGAFVAVPLYRVNTAPVGPHPAGSYEIWVPSESFVSVYSYICQHRGDLRSVGRLPRFSCPLALNYSHTILMAPIITVFDILVFSFTRLHVKSPARAHRTPCRDHEYRQAWMELGYSRIITGPTIEERKVAGRKIEETLRGDREAAPAPTEVEKESKETP